MKNFFAKIWVPALLVTVAAVQSFGIDISRTTGSARYAGLPQDSLQVDSVLIRSELSARDTIKVPDSLRLTDPFFYKYYIAVKDSTTRAQVRDSLIQVQDTLELMKLDSLYIKDSTETAIARHNAWYASLSRKERKKYDAEQALPGLIAAANRKLAVKDSIRARKDSIVAATPRILETFAFPDSMHYKRIVTWKHDRNFNSVTELREQVSDTSYNNNFHDYPFFKQDINAAWLGVIGSPVQLFDYFKRQEEENAVFYTPYRIYSYTPQTLPQYNTKTPYTELAYWGTLFANQEKEESNIKILTTQNITPELNITLEYHRFGGNGMLKREDTDNRTFVASTNYTGKKYLMHAGFIYNKVERSENGGITDLSMIRDTTVDDAREIDIRLKEASNQLKKNTVFLDQTYRIPFTFLDKEVRAAKKAEEREIEIRDSIMATGDSAAIAAYETGLIARSNRILEKPDTLNTDITTAFIGHCSEFSIFRKVYEDNISASDTSARNFFNDRFYLNPTTSKDSLRVMRLDNRIFIRLQPWKSEGIISKLDVGIGDKLLNYYSFRPAGYLEGPTNIVQNSMYVYAGANGQHRNYLTWNAMGNYTFLGHEMNDFGLQANVAFHFYPFRKDRKSPISFNINFETNLKEPDYYQQQLYTNHYCWNNDFDKISTSKLKGSVNIPRWDMSASFGYALLNNNIYYDTEGIARQNRNAMSVMTASLNKNFRIWKFHLDNRALLQFSSDHDVMPLPLLALNLRYYLQFDVKKNVMQMQIGANGTFTTQWYAPAYNPVLGVFFNQKDAKFGNCPYIDAFINIQWQRVSVFVKVVNLNMGWPNKSVDYFSAAGYIAPQRAIKFGISWPFWTFAGKNRNSAGVGSARGGNNNGRPGSGQQRATNTR